MFTVGHVETTTRNISARESTRGPYRFVSDISTKNRVRVCFISIFHMAACVWGDFRKEKIRTDFIAYKKTYTIYPSTLSRLYIRQAPDSGTIGLGSK